MLILPKIKFKRDPEELEEEIEEELEEESEEETGEESEEETKEEPEEETEEEPEQEPEYESEQELEEEPEQEIEEKFEQEIEEKSEQEPENEPDPVIEEEIEEESEEEPGEEVPEDLETSEEMPEATVTEAVPMPESPKKVRKKKPKELLVFRETEDGIYLTVMLGEEKQDEFFVSFFEDDENLSAEEIKELSLEELGKRIKKSLKNNRIRGKRAAYVIPEEDARIRRVTMPEMPEKQIRFNLPMEFRQDFPEGMSGKLFDFAHLKEEEAGEEEARMELLAAAVPLERMERARAMAGFAGCKLLMAAPESLSEESFFPDAPLDKKRKNVINFAHLGEKRLHPAAAALIAAVLLLLAFGVAKFGIIDRYASFQKKLSYVTELREKVEAGKAELSSMESVKEEYAHLTWSQMTDEECEQIERIRIGALLNFIAGQGAKVKSATLSGSLLMVSVTADSLETISNLTASIEEQDIVESCTVTTAEKEEQTNEVNYAALPSEVMEVEVDDSIPVEEIAPEDDQHGKKEKKNGEGTEEESGAGETAEEGEEAAEEPTALPEVEYPEGTVEAQLRIYLKNRSDTLGASEDVSEFEAAPPEETESTEQPEEATENDVSEAEGEEPSAEEEPEEQTPEEPEGEAGEEESGEELPTVTLDENGNPIIVTDGNTGETY